MANITSLGFSIYSQYNGDGVRQASRDLASLQGQQANQVNQLGAMQRATAAHLAAWQRGIQGVQQQQDAWRRSMAALQAANDNQRRSLRQFSDEMAHFNRSAKSMTSGMGAMRVAMIGLAPALLPVAEVAGAVAGGMAAMTIAAGSAVGAYLAVGNAAGKAALQARASGKELSAAEKSFVSAYDGMMNAWEKLVDTTGKKTLEPQIQVIKGLTAGIKGMAPVIDAIHPSIMKVATAFREWMEGPGFERFRDGVIKFGVPAFDRLQEAGRNALAALGIAYRTFLPMSDELSKGILKASEAFRKWAEGGGFERFLERAREAMPYVIDLLKALWQVFEKVMDVVRVLAPYALAAATAIAQFVASIPTPVLAAIVAGFIALRLAMTAIVKPFTILKGLFGTGGVFSGLAPMIPAFLKFAGIIGAIATAVALAWKHSGFFRDRVRELWAALQELWTALQPLVEQWKLFWDQLEPVRAALGQVIGFILGVAIGALTLFVKFITGLVLGLTELWQAFNTLLTNLPEIWSTVWNALKTTAETVWNALTLAWNTFVGALGTAWTTVSTALVTAWNAVWSGLQTAAQVVWTALTTAWNAFTGALATAWSTVSGALVTAWNAVWSGLQTAAQTVWTALTTAWNAFVGALSTAWNAVSGALTTAWSTVWNALQTAAQAVWTALTTAWNAFINGLQTVWSTVSSALSTAWSTVWNGLQTAAQTIWTAIQTAWQAVCNAFQTAWNAVSGALTTAWNTVWNALKTAAETVWNALKTAWDTLWTGVRAAWDAFSSAFQSAWSTAWNAVKTAADTVWEALKAAWNATTNRIREIWDTFYTAFKEAWSAAWSFIKNFANEVWEAIKAAWNATTNRIREIWDTFYTAFKEAWSAAWSFIKNAAEEIWETLKAAWNATTNRIREIWDSFYEAFKTAWQDAWNWVKDTAEDIWEKIKTTIRDAINKVIDLVNGLIKGFNRITEFLDLSISISEIGHVNFDKGGVLTFAYGGITGMPKGGPGGCSGKGCGYATGGVANLRRGGTLSGYAPGRDTVPAMLSRGEGVLTPEAVRGLGGAGFVHSANRRFAGHRGAGQQASSGMMSAYGFARGGMVGGVQHFAVGGITAEALKMAGIPLSMITQGEFSDGSKSAGTHLGGGAVDISSTDPKVLARLKEVGFAAWIRGNGDGMDPHIHAVLMNHPQLSSAARSQVESFKAGGSGLGAGGGGGIDVMGMVSPHVGKILQNVYRGLEPLAGITGDIIKFFLGGADRTIDPDPQSGGDQARRRELMERAEKGDKDAIHELAQGASDATLDRDSIAIQPSPFTGRPSSIIGAAMNSASNRAGYDQSKTTGLLAMLAKFVLPAIKKEHLATAFGDAKKGFDGFGDGGNFGKMIAGFGHKLVDEAIPEYVLKKAAAATPPSIGGGTRVGDPKAVQEWAGLAAEALKRAGLSSGQLGAFLALMAAESGGDPNASNNWDVNAKNGVPSQGLMQVIPPTFAAHRDPSLPNNILDPLANMTAAARYIKARYGGNVPGSPYANGTNSATPGLHLVGEQGPELVGLGGPAMANFSGGQSVLPADQTAALLNGSSSPTSVTASTGPTGGLALPEKETQKLLNQGGFEGISEAADKMAKQVGNAWQQVNQVSADQWQSMSHTTMAEAVTEQAVDMPTAAGMMRDASNAAWLDMNLQSATQWILMRDTTFTEAEFHQGTQMPLMMTTMQAAWSAGWLDMMTQSTTQWTAIRDTVFLPMEEHMSVTMVAAADAMNEGVSAAFTAMGETITQVLDAGIAKMDEFIAKAEEAIAKTAELVAAVAEAQAAMASMAAAGAAGGTAGGGVSGNVESWRALALEAMAAGGLDPSQIDAFLALMQAESGGDPNAINNWDSNAANGTPSIGLMQVIQPTFDAHNVTGGNIYDPFANMAASAAYIKARYGGIVPGSPYARGTTNATPGMHLVGEQGPELVGMNGPEFAAFAGGETVLTASQTAAIMSGSSKPLITALDETISAIDAFIAKVEAGIAQAHAMKAAAAAAAARGMGNGSCAMPNAEVYQGPNNPGGVAASAGTHDGGGVYDFAPDQAALDFLRANGWAAWMRGNGDGMSPHIHAVCMNAPDLSPQAAWQVQDYLSGGSGLGIPALYRGTNNAQRGWSWVGEEGPELMWMRGGEKVMPNGDSMKWAREGGARGRGDWNQKVRDMADHVAGEISGRGGHDGCSGHHIEFNFNGPVHNGDEVRRAVDEAIPKLRSALQARSGARTGG